MLAWRRFAPWVLAAAGIASFANGLDAPFVFDDRAAVLENEHRTQLLPVGRALGAPPQSPVAGRPIPCFTLALNYALMGDDVRGYRALNLALHVLAALALYGIVRRTLEGQALAPRLARPAAGLALAAALLWLLHPVQTECVDYITQRTESLMGLFYLLTLYAAIRASEGPGRAWPVVAVIGCAAGMACKESMVTAPVAVAIYDLVFGAGPPGAIVRKRGRLWGALGATWIVLVALVVSGPRSSTVGFGLGVSPWDYALGQFAVVWHYLRLIVWPHPLAVDYGQPEVTSFADVALPALGVGGALAAAGFALWRRPRVGFPLMWFFLILAPTSTIVPITSEVGADRRMYLALAGPVVFAVVAAYSALGRRVAPSLFALAIALAVWGTVARNAVYRDPLALWASAVDAWPDNPRAHNNLGAELELRGRLESAEEHYRRAIALKPDYPSAHHNLGNVLSSAGRQDEAIAEYAEALRLDPQVAAVHNDLGIALQLQRRYDEAIREHLKALDLDPRMFQARENLERAYRAVGRAPQDAR